MSCDLLPLTVQNKDRRNGFANSVGIAKSRFGFNVGCSLLSISAFGTCQTVGSSASMAVAVLSSSPPRSSLRAMISVHTRVRSRSGQQNRTLIDLIPIPSVDRRSVGSVEHAT